MHPILRDTTRLAIYVAAWLVVGVLMALVLAGPRLMEWRAALLLSLPLAILYGFICLAVWYPCRATPIAGTGAARLAAVHASGAGVSTALWLAIGWTWGQVLDRTGPAGDAADLFRGGLALFVVVGILLYMLAVVLHYLLLAFEASRRAESEALEARLAARQAELDAFRAQIDPHFLFNCLNSISSLCGSDPPAARRTATRLGEFLRSSLELGRRDTIPLGSEIDLARAYLDVEKARFGDRLVLEEEVDRRSLDAQVPPLLLQPLLENALKHGIAHLVEPGSVGLRSRITASSGPAGGRLALEVVNSCDPDRPAGRGTGIGLANVRGRLRLLFGDDAYMNVRDDGDRFAVQIVLPIEEGSDTVTQDEAEGGK